MKTCHKILIGLVLVLYGPLCHSQNISLGLNSGINFSDMHGTFPYGKWKFMPGATESLDIDYSLGRIFGVRSGLNFSTLYYQHVIYFGQIYDITPLLRTSYLPGPAFMYTPYVSRSDFRFITLPLQARISIPSKPRLDLAAGVSYSLLLEKNTDMELADPEGNDWGFLYSAGLSYPLGPDWEASLKGEYYSGRKKIYHDSDLRHGSMALKIGIAYNGLLKTGQRRSGADTSTMTGRMSILYRGGVNISRNRCRVYGDKYSSASGPSIGFALSIPLAKQVYFQTGISWERTGYSLRDSSSSYFRYTGPARPSYSQVAFRGFDVNTSVSIDYLVIPALFNLYFGSKEMFYLGTGPYLGIRLNSHVAGVAYESYNDWQYYEKIKITVWDDLEGVTKPLDFGWVTSGGVQLPLSGKLALDLGVQYRIGMIDVFDRSFNNPGELQGIDGSVIRNGALAIQIGLRVPVNR